MSRFSIEVARLAGMRDEVDELVEAWARERGDLDLAPVAVFSRISRLARHLDLARRQAFTDHGIESWEFDVLAALRRAGAPYELSPGRLLRETLVTSGTMTNRVDRLAARGYVERYPDPEDRRGVIVRLTAEGKTAVDAAFEALLEAEKSLLAELPAKEQKRLAGLLRLTRVGAVCPHQPAESAQFARISPPSRRRFPGVRRHSSSSAASSHSSSSRSFSSASAFSSALTSASFS